MAGIAMGALRMFILLFYSGSSARRRSMVFFHALLLLPAAQWLAVPPVGYDGYKYGSCDAAVHLEMFVDLLCGSCKAAFPTIEAVAASYGPSTLQLTVHTIPAPWHTWAFITAQSLHTVAASNRSAVLPWLRLVFVRVEGIRKVFVGAWPDRPRVDFNRMS